MTTPLQAASQAVIDRWDSPAWKDQPHTAEYIEELRKALDAELAQSVEPVAWAMRRADGLVLDVICPDEHESHEGEYKMPLYLHPPQPQATTPTPEEIRKIMLASELKTLARKGCGDCYQQDCNWPECSPKAMALKQAAAQGEKP